MKSQWWVYAVVVLASVGAGVAIAGIPTRTPREPDIVPPTTTQAPSDGSASDEVAPLFEEVVSDVADDSGGDAGG